MIWKNIRWMLALALAAKLAVLAPGLPANPVMALKIP